MTTNLLKQAQDKANTANLNAQNSQNKQTQQNIGNAISMGNNVLSMQTNQNTLSQANNTIQHYKQIQTLRLHKQRLLMKK